MSRFVVAFALVFPLVSVAPAQPTPLATYNAIGSSGGSLSNTANPPSLSASSLTGSNILATGDGTAFVGTGFTGTAPTGLVDAEGYQFTLVPAVDGSLTLTSLSFVGTTAGPTTFSLVTDVTGTEQVIGSATSSPAGTITFGTSGLTVGVTANTPYSFVLAGFGAAGDYNLTDLALTGSFTPTPVPEPAIAGLLAVAGLGLVRAVRRRGC